MSVTVYTGLELCRKMNPDIADRLVRNTIKQRGEEKAGRMLNECTNLWVTDLLWSMFRWDESDEGYGFWREIARIYENAEKQGCEVCWHCGEPFRKEGHDPWFLCGGCLLSAKQEEL